MDPASWMRLNHVRLPVASLDEARRFCTGILGLELAAEGDGQAALRSDERLHSLCLVPADEAPAVGIELPEGPALEAVAERLRAAGFACRPASTDECRRRFVRRGLIAADASGNAVELVVRPAHRGTRHFPSRDAGITGLGAVGLRSTDVERDTLLWTAGLGARVSDWVGDIVYLQIDEAHHRIALYPSRRPGVLYTSYRVGGLDDLMHNRHELARAGVRIVHGPGRETASGEAFLRFRGPDGHVLAYGCGMAEVDPAKHRPRQFLLERRALCSWGSRCTEPEELDAEPMRPATPQEEPRHDRTDRRLLRTAGHV